MDLQKKGKVSKIWRLVIEVRERKDIIPRFLVWLLGYKFPIVL